MRKIFLFTLLTACTVMMTMADSWIRVNQLGYLPQATKVAVYMSNDDVQVDGFELIDALFEHFYVFVIRAFASVFEVFCF